MTRPGFLQAIRQIVRNVHSAGCFPLRGGHKNQKGNPMAEFSATEIYARMAEDLLKSPPLPVADFFDNSLVRQRVGQIISEAASQSEKQRPKSHTGTAGSSKERQ